MWSIACRMRSARWINKKADPNYSGPAAQSCSNSYSATARKKRKLSVMLTVTLLDPSGSMVTVWTSLQSSKLVVPSI